MRSDASIPSYERLFGELDLRTGDEARSVYSPAAYLTDLLTFLQETFHGDSDVGSLLRRRPGIGEIPLDEENTTTTVPYLDIVNEVLEALVGDDPYEKLADRDFKHPLALPFSLDAARFTTYLRHLGVDPVEFYRLFAATVDRDRVTRDYLGLTEADVHVITTPRTDAAGLAAAYGLDGEPISVLHDVERFLEATSLTGAELTELLYGDPDLERSLSGTFVHQGAVVEVGEDGRTLALRDGGAVPDVWLDRAHRFIRLAKKTGLSFTDLDRVVGAFTSVLEAETLRAVAAAAHLHRTHDVPFDLVETLTTRTLPAEVDDLPRPAGDILAPQNRTFRRELARSIDMAESELVETVRRFRERYAGPLEESPFDREISRASVVVLHRVARLTGHLGLSVAELFAVLTALENDPAIERHSTFPVLPVLSPASADVHRMLERDDDPVSSLWLAQTLVEVVAWMRSWGFAGEDLTGILGEPATPESEAEQAEVVASIADQFATVALTPAVLMSDRFDERAARVIHEALATHRDGVVSPHDPRLLRLDPAAVATAAYHAVDRLGVLAAGDFEGLGLADRLTSKIFANLVTRGILRPDGLLASEDLPDRLTLAGDFAAHRDALFTVIAGLENAFYPSDLAGALPQLTEAERAELYDNLVHNGHLGDEGDLTDPEFFAEPANVTEFRVNAPLDDVAPAVLALLKARVSAYREARIALDPAAFAELRLTAEQLDSLAQSLRFNGFVDADLCFTDKAALAGLDVADFGIALEFYPLRRVVLDAIKAQLAAAKAEMHLVTPEDFAALADQAMAARVVHRLEGPITRDGRVHEELRGELDDAEGTIDLGEGFTDGDGELVFERVAALTRAQAPYRIDLNALTELGFDDDERPRLVEMLVEAGHLTPSLAVPEARLGYFRQVTSALDFTLPGVDDYAKDVFFVLHATAKEQLAAIVEIAATLGDLADRQHRTLLNVLQDVFGVSSQVVEAIGAAVAPGALDVLVAPAVAGPAGGSTGPDFRRVYRRLRRFARLAAKLGLDVDEVTVAFRDQDLAGKFPEPLALPRGVDRFDALLTGHDGLILLFRGGSYWTYSAGHELTDQRPKPLTELSPRFSGLTAIDAAFTRDGADWLIGRGDDGRSHAFTRATGEKRWAPKAQTWGAVRNGFTAPKKIDGAYVDAEGRTHLFTGDQYLRYSADGPFTVADEGFPRSIAEWWQGDTPLPERFRDAVDAVFHGHDGRTHVFSSDRTFDGRQEQPINERWGLIRNTFDGATRVDAAYADAQGYLLFAGNQVIRYTDNPENDEVRVADGYPQRIETWWPGLPVRFESAVEAAFAVGDTVHLFKDGQTVSLPGGQTRATADVWGVPNEALPGGRVDAAFVGLDGKTYLFSGDRYIRYSSADYSVVDPGYPRAIEGDWGGLDRVDAAFVMDGSAHLFGPVGLILDLPADYEAELADGNCSPALRRRLQAHGVTVGATASVTGASPQWQVVAEGNIQLTIRRVGDRIKVYGDDTPFYVRYSTRDYTRPDEGYPKPLAENWLNLPDSFGSIDAVFTGRDNETCLFSGGHFAVFDNRHRWWSEPRPLGDRWDSIPFQTVDAAFVGKDGKTYVFSGPEYVRYSTADYTEIDDRYPATTANFWGNVVNTIQRTGRVDATLVVDVTEKADGIESTHTYTYLFSGAQYVRYRDHDYDHIQFGYPKALSSLRSEPRLQALTADLDGVDAAFADGRTVYLFRGDRWHAVSDSLTRSYPIPGITAAYVDHGSVMVQTAAGWRRQHALEGPAFSAETRPLALRAVPADYRTGLDAVLTGADGNLYLFKGPMCFNTAIGKDYPLDEEWGRPRNTIYQDNAVDAAFVGRDGRTYLFSGDQFVVYGDSPDVIDGEPRLIADHWGGLTGVALAYYRDGKTYVFERPDASGMMRHLVYSGDEGAYTTPDPGYPALTDETFWKAPDGFPMPDAVIFEGDTMVLLAGERCVQFSEATGLWSYPRPIERVWRGFSVATGDRLRSAFTGADGATYFFFTETYTRYADRAFSAPEEIRSRWGRSVNPFGSRVDAAVVCGGHTYVFGGAQYVRYTGDGYRYTDPGYPKPISVELRREAAFAGLPEAFEDAVLGGPVTAAVANGRTAHLVVGDTVFAVSTALTATYPLGLLGRVRNTVADRGKVDAALVRDRHTYLFSGDQYVRYTGGDYLYIDEGFPRTIAGDWDLPADFQDGVDAAFLREGVVYFFKGGRFVAGTVLGDVAATFGKIRNDFADGSVVDAAFVSARGELYVFRGAQYVRYSTAELKHADEGFPRTIRDDFGDLPRTFEEGVTGAFTLGEATYLVKQDKYVRYSGRLDVVDRTFPQLFRHRWSDAADYRLSDVHTITEFADLARRHSGLAELLAKGAAEPYEKLAEIFPWDVEELRWAKRNAGLITEFPAEDERFEIEFLLKLVRLFAVAAKTGAGPSKLHGATADTLEALLPEAVVPLAHDDLNVLKRDALVPAVLHLHPELATAAEIYEHALIDVAMGKEGVTSRIREAIAATQLYLHRYLLDLEELSSEEDVKPRLRTWWTWLKNYRIWEANRKVFLYPENYIRPELRDTKTPAFKELEDDLLQGEITPESVQRAYKRYLDEYTEVSRLAIAGAYVYRADDDAEGTRQLVLFGRTRTEPRRWYFREAEFRDGERLSASWEPWSRVDVQIEAEQVHPVHAFGRVFVFWTIVESVAPEDTGKTVITTTTKDDEQNVSAPPPKKRVRVCYSFQNLNREWVAPQTLPPGALHEGVIVVDELTVRASSTVPGKGTHDSIVVSAAYRAAGVGFTTSHALTPELYALPIEAPAALPRPIELGKVFAEAVGGLIPFNMPAESTDGAWFSVDHKGGSFLVRPITADPGEDAQVLPLKENTHRLPGQGGDRTGAAQWTKIDAGFQRGDSRYYFNGPDFVVIKPSGPIRTTTEKIADRWGDVGDSELSRTGRVDAVLVRDGHYFIFTGAEYYRFTGLNRMDLGYPKLIRDNPDGLPKWNSINVAFTMGGIEYFINGSDLVTRDIESGVFSTPTKVASQWGTKSRVQAALTRGTTLFLIFDSTYAKYSDVNQHSPDKDYPRDLKGNPDLLPGDRKIRSAIDMAGTPYYFGDDTYTTGTDSTPRPTRPLGRVSTGLNLGASVDVAYVDGDHLYLVSGLELFRYTMTGNDIPAVADAGYPKTLPQKIDATFKRGDQRYVFAGADYTAIPADKELTTIKDFVPIEGNWRSLPPDFVGTYNGAMDTDAELILFLGVNFAVNPKGGVLERPYEWASVPHEIVRLTSSTAFELNRRLLVGGVPALLAPETQEIDELPSFSTSDSGTTVIKVLDDLAGVPASSHIDFQSANGRYYWEIFFHAPMLIAQALNAAQRFEDAKRWYEYVFDPTEPERYWRFLPFLAIDLRALVEGCRIDLRNLPAQVGLDMASLLADLETLAPLFDHARACTPADLTLLDGLADRAQPFATHDRLREKVGMIARLRRQYDLMGDRGALLKAYLDDPFDPHAIAALRPTAYRRAVVMAYVDNLLDWGDLLFRQYTMESVDEARMLYILAYDLLGDRPQGVGRRRLPDVRSYKQLGQVEEDDPYAERVTAGGSLLDGMGAIHRGVAGGYFFIPGNAVLGEYWDRVEDRLRKIRASLDILGVSRPLPLFEPPADVMALVRGAAAGLTPDQVSAGLAGPVPHYRFGFLHRKAQDLVDRLRAFGGELLSVLERRDAEELSILQNRQEAGIRQMTRAVREAQVEVATEYLAQMEASREAAEARQKYYEKQIADGLTSLQRSQLDIMTAAAATHLTGAGLKVGAAIAFAAPQVLAGPFILGTMIGGEQVGKVMETGAEIAEALGEGLSVLGELYGVRVEQERQEDEWAYQVMLAKADHRELGHQVASARAQLAQAQRDLEIIDQEIADLEAVATFLTGKFTNAELYQWQAGRLAQLYFASYGLAHETAKAAERAYQYEQGVSDSYIQPVYWESRRSGLLAGESLGVDLERLGNAYVAADSRGFEITKRISLLQLDPLAVLNLKNDGRCEFALTEALFDRDFPGHYARRIKTVSVVFDGPEGPLEVNAVLTQTGHKTVLTPDPKAVRYLLDGKGDAPASIRSDWRPSQQIALSDTEQHRDNNGLFELRFDDERYLPFEGTGAVSTWKMEVTGRRPWDLFDVTLLVKYTAEQGGDVFANAVRGMRKPYAAARYVDVAGEFASEWEEFTGGGDLVLPLTPEMFPDIVGVQLTGLYARYELADWGSARLLRGGQVVNDGTMLRIPGLRAEELTFTADGDREALVNVGLILTYRAI
ncbi:hemopexin repeat-containing protein [Herbidospora sp. NBRC 101105]|uniref:Tc toxin subunit A-related protein n=1 Tax=Herbidospora sp. NBRC 101105 TaxID=3032195 RepID=UPI002552AFB8|nr:hemopexin repeat-containing protein [Herbidospora sp. NBRC 101105]